MKRRLLSAISLLTILTLTVCLFPGCSQNPAAGSGGTAATSSSQSSSSQETSSAVSSTEASSSSQASGSSSEPEAPSATQLTVRFGDNGTPFALYLYDNSTAAAIARHVGTADWRLPIYHYDDYEGWEVMQYYDIPSRYEIPSNAQSVDSEAAGTVYYSEPNRIVLFYHDAEISGEYSPVGYFDYTDEFVTAVEENPVLEGWGNKIVRIGKGE